jgi:hypothetical protein
LERTVMASRMMRPHHKVRTGCAQCKSRRIKVAHPSVCRVYTVHELMCSSAMSGSQSARDASGIQRLATTPLQPMGRQVQDRTSQVNQYLHQTTYPEISAPTLQNSILETWNCCISGHVTLGRGSLSVLSMRLCGGRISLAWRCNTLL